MKEQPVVVMTCFARSGGTVLNKCIASMPGIVMLSELNPLGGGWSDPDGKNSRMTVQEQARHWYQIPLQAPSFKYGIAELASVCEKIGRQLVIRDWSYINFMPHPYNGNKPPKRLLTLETISEELTVRPFALVRDAIDVWISRGAPAPDEFFPDYLTYVRAILATDQPIFRYEDFCANPGPVLRAICAETGITYDRAWTNYAACANVNGDVQILGGSRGMRQNAIRPLPRRKISQRDIDVLHKSAEMMEANRLLGYSPFYHPETQTQSSVSHIELGVSAREDFAGPRVPGSTRQTASDTTSRKAHVAASEKLRRVLAAAGSGGDFSAGSSPSKMRRKQLNPQGFIMDEKNTSTPNAATRRLHSEYAVSPMIREHSGGDLDASSSPFQQRQAPDRTMPYAGKQRSNAPSVGSSVSFLRTTAENSPCDEDISIEEMRDSLLEALARGDRAPENLTLLAQSALEVGDFETARRCLEATLILDDSHAGARVLLRQLTAVSES